LHQVGQLIHNRDNFYLRLYINEILQADLSAERNGEKLFCFSS
jgi:hypothetical protein